MKTINHNSVNGQSLLLMYLNYVVEFLVIILCFLNNQFILIKYQKHRIMYSLHAYAGFHLRTVIRTWLRIVNLRKCSIIIFSFSREFESYESKSYKY